MINRPPVQQICYIDEHGNPHTFVAGSPYCTEIREVEEAGDSAFVPWVEVWNGDKLIARFNQHKLEHILY